MITSPISIVRTRRERQCLVAGSLCTPHDIWGYGYFGDGIQVGDVLLVPNQGAYTYSLRQEFIKPLPKSVELPHSRCGITLDAGEDTLAAPKLLS